MKLQVKWTSYMYRTYINLKGQIWQVSETCKLNTAVTRNIWNSDILANVSNPINLKIDLIFSFFRHLRIFKPNNLSLNTDHFQQQLPSEPNQSSESDHFDWHWHLQPRWPLFTKAGQGDWGGNFVHRWKHTVGFLSVHCGHCLVEHSQSQDGQYLS